MIETLPEPIIVPKRRVTDKPGRPIRRIEENVPDPNYMNIVESLGPRVGETYIAFVKRIAATRAARKLLLDVWKEFEGRKHRCVAKLGIRKGNLSYELRQVGLTSTILDAAISDEEKLDVQKES